MVRLIASVTELYIHGLWGVVPDSSLGAVAGSPSMRMNLDAKARLVPAGMLIRLCWRSDRRQSLGVVLDLVSVMPDYTLHTVRVEEAPHARFIWLVVAHGDAPFTSWPLTRIGEGRPENGDIQRAGSPVTSYSTSSTMTTSR